MAKRLKNLWRERKEENEQENDNEGREKEDTEPASAEEEEVIAKELKDEEMMMSGESMDINDELCINCVMMPCVCLMTYLEMKIT